ncbi:hypothetical protein Pcac1_g10909 [Phytophthora cactorum]|nr:hypothetical protein Pcac1_g10909 [Phytophthora cactorum]
MKSPSNYGSENEETNFIRRVAAPDRPNSKRRQKKRLAIAGAAMLLVGAAAGVGFATLQSTQSNTMATQQMAANLVVPDFVETMGDPYFPSFDELDENGDGVVAYGEYMKDLNEVWDQDRENIKRSDLPDVVKQDLNNQLDDKIASDSACVKKAMVPTKKRTLSFDRKTINSLYYMLEVYCFETPIEIPQKYMDMFPETKAPVPPAPVIPEIPAPPAATEAATSAPIEVSTPGGGQQTITLVGPAVDSQQKVEIETGGGVVTTTVQVEQTASGGEKLDIPTPGGQTTTVIVPENNIPTTENGSGFKNEQQTVNVETPQGPATVTVESPVIDGKQEVTITTTDGMTTTATADVTPTENGDNELEIPGPDGTTTTVTIPSTPTEGGQGGEGGYPSEQQTGTQSPLSIQIDTATGLWTVFFNGPVTAERTQSITILKHDGSSPETVTVDVLKYTDGSLWVEVPLGPGPATVETTGPVIDGKQEVTITTTDGTTTTATADVTPTENGDNELEIPGPDGTTTTVTIPSTPTEGGQGGEGGYPSEQQTGTQSPLSIQIDTATGLWTVFFNGPVTAERTQSITILKHDGSSPETVTVDVLKYTDGSLWVEVPLGPGESPRRVPIPVREGEYGTATTTTVSVMTPEGPATVETTGPVIDGKQEVTITTTDGTTTTATADVTPTENGDNELEIPGPDGTTTTVTIPSTPTEGGQGGEGGYPSEQQTGTQSPLSIQIDTATGLWTVFFNGPVTAERTQSITILKHDGSSPETVTVDVLKYTDGSLWVEVPLGPGESPRRVPIPVREGEYDPCPDGTTTTVTIPSTPTEGGQGGEGGYPSEQQTGTQSPLSIQIDTATGLWTVFFNGPVTAERTQSITILKHDGSSPETVTVDVLKRVPIPVREGEYGTATTTTVSVMTPEGPATVETTGPVIDGKQEVTITTTDGTTTTATADVTPTENGDNELEIPGPDGTTTTVTIPSTPTEGGQGGEGGYPSEQQTGTQSPLSIQIDTATGLWTVFFNGPVTAERTQSITILKHDGSSPETVTVDVLKYTDGSLWVEVPLGPGESPRRVPIPVREGEYGTATTTTVSVMTPEGPATVETTGPVIDGKQELEIPGPDGTTTTVTIPSTPTEGGQGGEGGYPSEQQTGTQSPLSIQIDTATGLWTVFFNGPVTAERTQSITILKHDGSSPETVTVDVLKYTDGSLPGAIWLRPRTNGQRDDSGGPRDGGDHRPVIDGTQEVTITTTDGMTTTATADVTPTENGDNELEIPGPDGTTTTVTIPSTPDGGRQGGEGGYRSETANGTQSPRSLTRDTATGLWTVFFNGPVTAERTQSITILKHDGSSPETVTVDVLKYTDGSLWVEVPAGSW